MIAGLALPALALATLRAFLLAAAARQRSWGLAPRWAAVRLALLAAACAPPLLAAPLGGPPHLATVVLALAGELVDRAAFFRTLEPASPTRILAAQAARALPATG